MRPRRRTSYFDAVNELELDDSDYPHDINSDSLYSSLACTGILAGHTGCVNATAWREDGLILASGSDDRNLCLWSFPGRELLVTLPTGHTQNIFGLTFLPTAFDRIITVAGDGLAKFIQIRDNGTPTVVRTWSGHRDRVKRVETEPFNPNIFFTASEDGSVGEFDLRLEGESHRRLADWSQEGISLNSISLAQLRPHLIAAAGTGPIVRFIDRRKQDVPSGIEKGLIWMPLQRNIEMVTAVRFSNHSMDLIASLINDDIHMANYEIMERGEYPKDISDSITQKEESIYAELARKWEMGELEDYYYSISQLITRHRSLQHGLIQDLMEIFACDLYNRMLCAVKLDRMEDAETDALYLIEEGTQDPELLRLAYLVMYMQAEDSDGEDGKRERYQSFKSYLDAMHFGGDAPPDVLNTQNIRDPRTTDAWQRLKAQHQVCSTSLRAFRGHLNTHTVKDVTFLGPQNEYIASGSDGGYFFIWDRNDPQNPIYIASSDSQVVNSVVENPRMPMLAVTGIDNDIKLWEPTANEEDALVNEEWRSVPREHHKDFMGRLGQLSSQGIPMLTVPCPVQ